jgi:Xaa-Pro aminopeptidase
MRKPREDVSIFKARRTSAAQKMSPRSAMILTANPEFIRNNDVHYPYRQDSSFYYMTGFEEPESILLFRPGLKPETVMFVRKKDMDLGFSCATAEWVLVKKYSY